jgi:hypothetical protein
MSISFHQLLDDCMLAIGDVAGATWSRADVITPWAKEAMLAFPILRPTTESLTVAIAAKHNHKLPVDFREIVSVEYPIGEEPPVFLTRMNHFDPQFYQSEDHFDVSRYYLDYVSYTGWMVITSKLMPIDEDIKVNYLANHNVDLDDDPADLLTVPDEYEYILVAYVVAKAYRERLSFYSQNPTVYTNLIYQMVQMVDKADARYQQLVNEAIAKSSESRKSPPMQVDKFDRVY